MNNKLFIGNLSYQTSEQELGDAFADFGTVVSCSVAKDRDTGRPKGFAFVEMQTSDEAEAAIKGLNGQSVNGRAISVSISQPKARTAGAGGRRDY
ncbi:hypothetical protein Lal_00015336 [Lupinus albus]|jgi:cold-inducible RNA-binding protein|nr:hypothetical protein Lal_00015336 [Lupinus albus]MBN9396512.1 RNA-binding protein [Candidatus Melainabacteria bacterium]MBX9674524.1 RNA-binding protein [Candidatus Obscuribacterales bacterium]